MKLKKYIATLFLFFALMSMNIAHATKLPDDVWKYVKNSMPQVNQRFDSVIVVSDNVMYIPLYPPSKTDVDEIKIEYTYPQGKSLSSYPEVVLFNNGYSLLKVFKDADNRYTLTKKDDLPIKVRLGIMPQDMLTPAGLKVPESLKLTLGDILIPSLEETSLALGDGDKEKIKNPYNPVVRRNEFVSAVDFRNKKVFINPKNSKFLEVYDNTTRTPLYELKLSSMPSKIVMSDKSKVALVLYWSGKNLEIINLKDENVVATIPIGANATDATINKKDNIAFVTSQNAKTIYVISLDSMEMTKAIELDQRPSKIDYSAVDDSLAFYDEFQQKVFHVTKNGDEYVVQPMGNVENVSKVVSDVANIYAISRTKNQISVFDKAQGHLLNTVDLDEKPTDAIIYGTKIFVLCSKEGYMNVYDTVSGKIISRERLSEDGFYSKMTFIAGENNILITGINAKNYLIYSLDKMELVKKQESYIDVNDILIYDKDSAL